MKYNNLDEILNDNKVPTALKVRINVAKDFLSSMPSDVYNDIVDNSSSEKDGKTNGVAQVFTRVVPIRESDGNLRTIGINEELGEYVSECISKNSDGTETTEFILVNAPKSKGFAKDNDGNKVEIEIYHPPYYHKNTEIKHEENEQYKQYFSEEEKGGLLNKFINFVSNASENSATPEDVETVFNAGADSDETDDKRNVFQRYKDKVKNLYKTPQFKARKCEAYDSDETNTQAESNTYYTDGSIVLNKQSVNIRVAKIEVDWAKELEGKLTRNNDVNLALVSKYITKDVIRVMGGLHRIKSLIVADDSLIVNKIVYVPLLKNRDILVQKLPLDVAGCITKGRIAQLFDWGTLLDMPNLAAMYIDTAEFFMYNIAPALKYKGQLEVVQVFKKLKSLQELGIGKNTVTRNSLISAKSTNSVTTESASIDTKIKKRYKVREFTDKLNLDITGHTRSWSKNNFKRGADAFMNKNNNVLKKVGKLVGWGTLGVVTGALMIASAGAGMLWDKYTERKDDTYSE